MTKLLEALPPPAVYLDYLRQRNTLALGSDEARHDWTGLLDKYRAARGYRCHWGVVQQRQWEGTLHWDVVWSETTRLGLRLGLALDEISELCTLCSRELCPEAHGLVELVATVEWSNCSLQALPGEEKVAEDWLLARFLPEVAPTVERLVRNHLYEERRHGRLNERRGPPFCV
ncbi:hypothetical protein [Chitinimonas lacunae]|uniref:Uncharacterized protein n=1 Tax=Chitinimonas lacunae TaxID=1963018 RepID=A0ABV8MQH7_9NEIS